VFPVLFVLPGGVPVYSYGVLLGLSICIGWFITAHLAETRDGFPPRRMGPIFIWTVGCAILGSRVLYVVTNLERFDTVLDVLRFTDGGLVAYGGFVGGFLGG
jgi:phosphatidylglycerol---prolipoprotein diacylglyceryl transferase